MMCRNIRTLFNFDPPATDEEIYASALQFIRKISGTSFPSKVNQEVFYKAVVDTKEIVSQLLESLETKAKPKNRAIEIKKAKERNLKRFGSSTS